MEGDRVNEGLRRNPGNPLIKGIHISEIDHQSLLMHLIGKMELTSLLYYTVKKCSNQNDWGQEGFVDWKLSQWMYY